MKFTDRTQAGELLADILQSHRYPKPVVIGLARGGVVVAAPVARQLRTPLDMIVSRKITHPLRPEYALGAVTEEGEAVWGGAMEATTRAWRIQRETDLRQFAQHMRQRYVGDRESLSLAGRTAILVDDGIATGLTMLAAVQSARRQGAEHIVAAVPVAAHESVEYIESEVDELVVLCEPVSGLGSVGEYYDNFEQVTDEEVRQLLSVYRNIQDDRSVIDLPSLNAVLAAIQDYPTSSDTIARQARRLHAPPSVVGFFESIPGGTTYENKADVINRSLSAEKLEEQELTEPPERTMPDD
jgi:putative phosphoribosyl transferase